MWRPEKQRKWSSETVQGPGPRGRSRDGTEGLSDVRCGRGQRTAVSHQPGAAPHVPEQRAGAAVWAGAGGRVTAQHRSWEGGGQVHEGHKQQRNHEWIEGLQAPVGVRSCWGRGTGGSGREVTRRVQRLCTKLTPQKPPTPPFPAARSCAGCWTHVTEGLSLCEAGLRHAALPGPCGTAVQ